MTFFDVTEILKNNILQIAIWLTNTLVETHEHHHGLLLFVNNMPRVCCKFWFQLAANFISGCYWNIFLRLAVYIENILQGKMKVWSQITMSFGRIILPIETNQSTIGTHNCVRMKNYLTCTKIASQCGLLSAHINLPAVTCNNMSPSTDFCKRYDGL
jgi:hypothetical protein